MRSRQDVTRGKAIVIQVDGTPIKAFEGETVLAAMITAGRLRMHDDRSGTPRGFWCNMGTCSECLVDRVDVTPARRTRACLLSVEEGMRVATGASADD